MQCEESAPPVSPAQTKWGAASCCQQTVCYDLRKTTFFFKVLWFHIASHVWRYWPKAMLQNEKGSPWWKVKHEMPVLDVCCNNTSLLDLFRAFHIRSQPGLVVSSKLSILQPCFFFFFLSALRSPIIHLFPFLVFVCGIGASKHILLCHIPSVCYCSSSIVAFSVAPKPSLPLCPESRL